MIERAFPGSHFILTAIKGFGDLDRTVLPGLTTPQRRPLAYELDSSWLGEVDAAAVANAAGNTLYAHLGENDPEMDGDILVSLDEDGEKVVEHVVDGQKVVAFAKSKAQTTERPLAVGPGGRIIGAGFPVGHYRLHRTDSGRSLLDIADAIVLIDYQRKAAPPESIWKDDAFWKELDRRNMALRGRPIDPALRKTKGASEAHH